MAFDRTVTKGDGRNYFGFASLLFGVLGVLSLPVLFPDISLACGLLAVGLGLIGVIHGSVSGSSRVWALVGLAIGGLLIVVAVLSLVTGGAGVSGGGPATGI